MKSYASILRIVLHGRSSGNILFATILSFAFSIAVILCTFGLMDGFDHLLKSGLRHSSGDLHITSRKGFFKVPDDLSYILESVRPHSVAPVIQTEAFALHQGQSRGVLVRGVEDGNFSSATGLDLTIPPGGVVLGSELARSLNVRVGERISLAMARGNESSRNLPGVKDFLVAGLVQHGIYQKDLRFIYLQRDDLAPMLGLGESINLLILSLLDAKEPLQDLDVIREAQQVLRKRLDSDFFVKPFWSEYNFLIEAVKVEKISISLILQLIVVVAVFNIIAFVIYIMEKKAQDFFFLRAVGLPLKRLMRFWLVSVLLIWALASGLAYVLAWIFNWALGNLAFLQIPGEIYVLSSLSIRLDPKAYITVYLISLLWILIAAAAGYWRLRNRPIIQGLRQEFT